MWTTCATVSFGRQQVYRAGGAATFQIGALHAAAARVVDEQAPGHCGQEAARRAFEHGLTLR